MRWLDGITNSKDMSFEQALEMVKGRDAWHGAVHGWHFEQALGDGEGQGCLARGDPWVAKSQTQLSN